MSIKKEIVTIEGEKFYRWYSDGTDGKYYKIQCKQDKNIYSVAYTTLNTDREFEQTIYPIDDVTITTSDVRDLSAYTLSVIMNYEDPDFDKKVIRVMDILGDGKPDDIITVSGGGAS